MKKIVLYLLMAFMACVLIGCKPEFTPTARVSIILPNGTPTLALGELLKSENDVEVVTDTTLLQTALTTGSTDLVICPLTMATNLYLKGKSTYKVEAIITTNNTYLVSRNALEPYSNLNGKSIVGFNEKNTPGIILKMFYNQNNIEANTQYEANVNASLNAFQNGNTEYAVISEPQLSQLQKTVSDLNILNLGKIVTKDFIPQAAIFVKADKAEDENVKYFLNQIKNNLKEMNENPEEYANKLMGMDYAYFNKLTKEVIVSSIPRMNLQYLKAKEYKRVIEQFYSLCDTYCNNLFGGSVPDENFYNN